MDILSIKRDSRAISEGRWFDKNDFPILGDARIRVRGLSAPAVVKYRAKLARDASADHRVGGVEGAALTEEANELFFRQAMAEEVLLEWDGFTEDGKPVPYSIETAQIWIGHPDYAVFADIVAAAASRVDETRAKKTGELAGNSPKSSAGKSKTTK